MIRRVIATIALAVATSGAAAQSATVVYLEGEPEHRRSSGVNDPLDFGSQIAPGEAVVTGRLDFVELEQGSGFAVRVDANTVFTVREVDRDGERETVLETTAGSVRYRFERVVGRREPRLGTPAVAAGVRGTEVIVSVGPDGTSLFVVSSGAVEVSAAGTAVAVTADQAVEVAPGAPPGEPFSVIGRQLDFSTWSTGRRDQLLADPAAAATGVARQLEELADGAELWYDRFLAAKVDSDAALARLDTIADAEERARVRDEEWFPLAQQSAAAVLNYRYYALSAHSLRRFVLGPMYVELRSRSIVEPVPGWESFRAEYESVLRGYEARIVSYLEPTDY